MKIKLDENLGHACAELLRTAGHDVSTVPEQSLAGADDERLIDVCRKEQRGLVTLGLDFANPLRFRPRDYGGIAVLRLPRKASFTHLKQAVATLVSVLTNDDLSGELWIVEPNRVRIHRPYDDEA